MEENSENPKFTASDARTLAGVTYRQINDWDSKGALPSQRTKGSGWRRFDPQQFFAMLVCAEVRRRFGVPIEKLAWLQEFMLQDGADHFSTAVKMMRHGLAVFIFTDLSKQFDMDFDSAIGDLLVMGYCRKDESQGYVLLLVNPIINKMLAALKQPMRLEITDKNYDALSTAHAATRVRDTAELEVLRLMRQPTISRIAVSQTNDNEVVLEIEQNTEGDGTVQKDQIPGVGHGNDRQSASISGKVVKKVTKEAIGIIAVRVKD